MSLLPQYKIGDCSIEGCGLIETAGRKVGKDFICLKHYTDQKNKVQIQKANDRNKVRSLATYQRTEGIMDSVQELTIDLDRVISRYVRLRDMGKDHKITCYICGNRVKWEKAHCMHFIPRQHLATRFLIDNLRSGCFTCNVEKRGNLIEFENKLKGEEIGLYEFLQEQSRVVSSPSRDELKQLLFDYQQRLKIVELKLK